MFRTETTKVINVLKWDGTEEQIDVTIPTSCAHDPTQYINQLLDEVADVVMSWEYVEHPYNYRGGDGYVHI